MLTWSFVSCSGVFCVESSEHDSERRFREWRVLDTCSRRLQYLTFHKKKVGECIRFNESRLATKYSDISSQNCRQVRTTSVTCRIFTCQNISQITYVLFLVSDDYAHESSHALYLNDQIVSSKVLRSLQISCICNTFRLLLMYYLHAAFINVSIEARETILDTMAVWMNIATYPT